MKPATSNAGRPENISFDEAWLAQSKRTMLDRVGETVRHCVEDHDSEYFWISVSTRWESLDSKHAENEWAIAGQLEHDHAILPVAAIRSQQGPILLYDGKLHASHATPGPIPLTTTEFLAVAVGASASLARIHDRQILHRDIRPSRVNRALDGSVRFSFFGRAAAFNHHLEEAEDAIDDELLPYAAPEYARRANHHVDERSDLYSLGIVFYELLVGNHPYSANSPAEWLYAHIAFQPERPSALQPGTPRVLDEIILKLISKDPAQRYQSAALLNADLLKCQADWMGDRSIEMFELGRQASLKLTGRLFGRQSEFNLLNETFDCVRRTGAPAIAFVSGPPGSGKTALSTSLLAGFTTGSATVGTGKSDQHQRQTPYAPVKQVLRSILDVLFGQGRTELLKTRELLQDHLGVNAKLVVDLVPEFELVLGKTMPLPELSADAARERMNHALIQSLTAFAGRGTPLVVILDDLQWADDSTWALLRKFTDVAPPNVMLIATYRDNELFHAQDLGSLRSAARSNAVNVCDINLGPLTPADVTAFVASAMDCDEEAVGPLAETIHAKTAGNAFFTGQFLRALVDEGVVYHDRGTATWTWNTKEVERRSHTDNVLDLMVRRLDRLSGAGRSFMKVLACIGSRSDEVLMARILDLDADQLAEIAMPMLEAGLVARETSNYRFAHDRILESAYALIPEAERSRLHTEIAALMIASDVDSVFDSANQVQRAGKQAVDESTRSAFISTLVEAARKARSAAAIGQAWNYLGNATELLGSEGWSQRYELAYKVAFLRCECLIVQVNLTQAFTEINELIERSLDPIDLAMAYRLRASVLTLRSDYEGTIASALAGLELLGIHLKRFPTEEEIMVAYTAVNSALNGREISELGSLPTTADPTINAATELLVTLLASIFIDDGISFLHVAKIVELTLIHGPTPASAHGLAWYGVFSADRFGVYQDGFAYGQAALDLIERNGWESSRPGVLVAVDQVSAWTRPLAYSLARAREAAALGHAGGDLAMACYAGNHIVSNLLCMGQPLSVVMQDGIRGFALAQRIQFKDIERLIAAQLAFAIDLKGRSDGVVIPDAPEGFSELGSFEVSQSTLFWEWLYRGMSAFFAGDFVKAKENLDAVGKLTWAVPAHINLSDYHLFAALTDAQQGSGANSVHNDRLSSILEHLDRLRTWAEINPSTFLNKKLLVEAEVARLKGNTLAAMQLYEASADAALSVNFLHEYALANELAAAHDHSHLLASSARSRLRAAKNGYRRWGAFAKVAQLDAVHPFLAVENPIPNSTATSGQPALDVAVAMEVARSLSEEIQLDKLIEELMRSMVIHAGANYGLLILIRNGEPVVGAVAELVAQNVEVTSKATAPTNDMLPMTVLNAVLRTRKAILIEDASQTELATQSASNTSRSAKSIICVPLVKQGILIGVLYLENNLTPGVFTPNRTSMLEMLAPQAAICLETARLYAELLEQNEHRRQSQLALRTARAELARTSHLSAMGGLTASISHEISQPLSSIQSNADASFRWLQRREPNIEEALQNVQSIRSDATRATAIVSAIRALAKRSPSILVPVSIDRLVTEVLELTSAELEAKRVTVSTSLNVGDVFILGDPIQLQQVILNLVTNGSDAMLGSERRQLTVVSSREETVVVVSVHDTGSGMSEETRHRIFDPLYTTKESGMGMGMAICRTIIEAHQGHLEVRSTSPGGTVTAFSLPISR